MTQRMVSHPSPLPPCRSGHTTRHIHDARRVAAGGGHLLECSCSQTAKHAEFDDALREWCRKHGHPAPAMPPQRALPLSNVMSIRRTAP